jgi:hypothetical protein
MDLLLIAEIVSIVLAVICGKFALDWKRAKDLLKSIADALNETYKIIEDDKITEDELKDFIFVWQKVLNIIVPSNKK